MERRKPFCRAVAICTLILALAHVATAQYGGGSGTPDDPYLITTAEQMNAIGADPNDWDKHFKLMADIDLAAYTGNEFNLIGNVLTYRGRGRIPEGSFEGTFDGNGHTISNFTYTSEDESGIALFRCISDPNAEVKNLGLIAPNVNAGTGDRVGALVGYLIDGTIMDCYVVGGTVRGGGTVGGLVGDADYGTITNCHSTATVTGGDNVGGLVGEGARVTCCYANGIVRGNDYVGGLAGDAGTIMNCYAHGVVIGNEYVGGLVGGISSITNCYAAALVAGASRTGGLAGGEPFYYRDYDHVVASFWDMEASMQTTSAGGQGRTKTEMQTLATYRTWGEAGNEGVWMIDEGNDYPRLAWENRPGVAIGLMAFSDLLAGTGMPGDPFLIYTAGQLDLIGQFPDQWDKHYKLMADIDLGTYTGTDFHIIGANEPFSGTFDGNRHTISNFTYISADGGRIGLFGYVYGENAEIKNLGCLDPDIERGTDSWSNDNDGVGAMVGLLGCGTIVNCYVLGGIVSGDQNVGGLVGHNDIGTIRECFSSAVVLGSYCVGGLMGRNANGVIRNCYATDAVVGNDFVGGLVGYNCECNITNCYAAGIVVGGDSGGLAGVDWGNVTASFWDTEISGQATSPGGGIGLATAEMQDADTFITAGWDFFGASDGPNPIWTMEADSGYPILWWQVPETQLPELPSFAGGAGTPETPYLISSPEQLNSIGANVRLMAAHFRLTNDVDLGGVDLFAIGSEGFPFAGVFDGAGWTISNLTRISEKGDYAGLFAYIRGGSAVIKDLGLMGPNIEAGTGKFVGSLVGYLGVGKIANCYVEDGNVAGEDWAGGLIGYSDRSIITECYARSNVAGDEATGGLVGGNKDGWVTKCCSSGTVEGQYDTGGLVGSNGVGFYNRRISMTVDECGTVTNSYSLSVVNGDRMVGGLIGENDSDGTVLNCYAAGRVNGDRSVGGLIGSSSGLVIGAFWDVQTSRQRSSSGGTVRTTAHMQTAATFLEAGWDFVGEDENGTEEIWWIDEGQGYPRLWWESAGAEF